MFNKYLVQKILKKSKSDQVYLVKHIKLEVYRVIKTINKSNKLYEQLINESKILKTLNHPCIPIIYDIEESTEYTYIIEEYIEGQSLKEYRQNHIYISQEKIIKYGIQICELIEYLHTRTPPILYLDLKPDNIIVKDNTLKLVDFGTAIYLKDVEQRKYLLGTVGYASPEQYFNKNIDVRSDIYSIGMILYFLITGIAFNNKDKKKNISLYNNCSKKLKNIINKSLMYYPLQRYQNVKQLKQKLSELINQKGINLPHKSLIISLAGSQERIGTTHVAFLLQHYLQRLNYDCVYMEANNKNTVRTIVNRYEKVIKSNGMYLINNKKLIPDYDECLDNIYSSYTRIKDYGVLNSQNKSIFLKSDIKIIVLGAKDWELDYSENIIKELKEYKNVYYMFNYIDSYSFKIITKNMHGYKYYRIPFSPDIEQLDKLIIELLDEMLKDILQNI